jgi:nitroimidazol reductase NimA-like FMN-containing flavoprotein (pyridoxamine 5'-phosphate oxidase superfamily)
MSPSHPLPPLSSTPRTQLIRHAERGATDRAALNAVIDEALIGHFATVVEGVPRVLPFVPWRVGDEVFFHAHIKNSLAVASTAPDAAESCMTITLLDGMVMARSAFHHSANFRCAVIYGRPRLVTDAAEKARVLQAMMDKVTPERAQDIRPANDKELNATAVVGLSLAEASLKCRSGGPIDAAADYGLPVWAGVIPYALTAGAPITDFNQEPPK